MRCVLLLFFTVSCSFTPILSQKNQEIYKNLDNIKVNSNYKGLKLRQKVILQEIAQFFVTKESSIPFYYIIIANIAEQDRALNLTRVGDSSEYSYEISLTATIYNQEHQKILTKNFAEVENYRINNNYYASQIKRNVIKRNLAKIIAQNIKTDLTLYLTNDQ